MTSLIIASILLAQGQARPPVKETASKSQELSDHHLPPVKAMSAEIRLRSYDQRLAMEKAAPFQSLEWRSVGSEFQGGRVVDVESPMAEPQTLYIAYATGGLWRTEDDGITWESLFDHQSSFAIGDLAVSSDGQTLWLGTGENNAARTHYSGTGVFKSTDRGKTWVHKGLAETHRIGRVLVDPKDTNTVFVAASGALYSEGPERGIYKSKDGGETWRKVLGYNDYAGGIDIAMKPGNSKVLYATMWGRSRRAWNILEAAPGGGVYKSVDAGESWSLIEALPHGDVAGRGGLAVSPDDPKRVYAYIDRYESDPETPWDDERTASGKLTPWRYWRLNDELLKQLSENVLKDFIERRLPDENKVEDVLKQLKDGTLGYAGLTELMLKKNENLFALRTYLYQLWESKDDGRTWTAKITLGDQMDYYSGRVTANPHNADDVYMTGLRTLHSSDAGATVEALDNENHVDKHVLWIDARNPKRMIDGNDGGPYMSLDAGKTWRHLNNIAVGQWTTLALDTKTPYNIYGGMQDNGTVKGASNSRTNIDGSHEWKTIGWGDGSMMAVDPREGGDLIYTSFQFGNFTAYDQATGSKRGVTPTGKDLRYNWLAPITISDHHPDIVYIGSQFVHRSFDKGLKWELISPDLTKNKKRGDVPFSTLTALDESPFKFGVIYAGADDGSVKVTKDGGVTWEDIATPAPERWVTRLVASQHDAGTVYCTQNGYRQDEWTPYVWKSTDYGKTWETIAGGLPYEPVNTIREDPMDPKRLYVGTDLGVFMSLDGGGAWSPIGKGMPRIAVHDLAVQNQARDLVAATHGRSAWVIDLHPIDDTTEEIRNKDLYIWKVSDVSGSERWGYDRKAIWDKSAPREPVVDGRFWTKHGGRIEISIVAADGAVVKAVTMEATPGYNKFVLGLMLKSADGAVPAKNDSPKTVEEALNDPYSRPTYVGKGTYSLKIKASGVEEKVDFAIK